MKIFVAIGVGGLCLIGAVAPRFDSSILYCRAGGDCLPLAAYLPPPKGAAIAEKRPGNGFLKSAAAIGAIASFSSAFLLARKHLSAVAQEQCLREVYAQTELRKAEMIAAEELRQFHNKLTQQAADAAFAALPPQEQALLMGATLDQQTSPTKKLEPVPPTPNSDGEENVQNHPQRHEGEGDRIALRLLDSAVSSNRSTLLVGATGTGKSVSDAYLLTKLLERFPYAEVWVICQKADSFNGLDRRGRVSLFDRTEPKASLEAIEAVWEIYEVRRRKREGDRNFKEQPVRLKLADWHSIYDCCRDEKWFSPYLKKLATLITVGRELNIALLIDSQSFNLDSLGLAKDTNIRQNLNLLAQGYSWKDEDGNMQGDYGVLSNLLANRFVISDNALRESLRDNLNALKLKSRAINRPIIFSAIEPPTLAILPDLRDYKAPKNQAASYSAEDLERIYKLEFQLSQPETPKRLPETPKRLQGEEETLLPKRFGKLGLSPEAAANLIASLREKSLNQSKIIEIVWGAKPGDNKAYKEALDEYQKLSES